MPAVIMHGTIDMATSIKELAPNLAFRIPYHPSVTAREMRRAAELLADYEKRAAETRKQHVRAFVATVERRRRTLRSLLGTQHHFALQQFKEELRLEAIKQRQPPHGFGMSRAELVRRRTRRVSNFLSTRGIKSEAVRATVARLFHGVSLQSVANVTGTLQLNEIELPPGLNPWLKFTPPYTGHLSGYAEGVSGYRISRSSLADPAAGQVGLKVTLDVANSGESDYGFVKTGSQISFWFQAPIAGLVEVVIDAQCGEARHELHLKNEWGFSDSSTTQRHFLMMQVFNPNIRHPSFSLASEFKHSGDDDDSFDEQHMLPGQDVRARLISDGAMRAGEWAVISAGCLTDDFSEANDMEVHSRSTFVWFIKRVSVRVLE